MAALLPIFATPHIPAIVQAAGPHASTRFLEFFVSNIRNPHTRRVIPYDKKGGM
jgi:hypothetical protein